ncbi:MAG: SipW-dependent-type signal peptide-containing protein [Haloplanus sp.]
MPDDTTFDLTRRRILAGLGGIGAVAAGAGAGTSAYFSDSEELPNRIVAGQTDLKVDWQQTVEQSPTTPVNAYPDPDGDGVQSVGGVNTAGADAEIRPHHVPDACGRCADPDYALRQGEQEWCISAVEGQQSVTEFYDFQRSDWSSGNTAIQAADTMRVFFYREQSTGDVYLVVINDSVADTDDGGDAIVEYVGLQEATNNADPWVVGAQDDPDGDSSDSYSATRTEWHWNPGKTDGGAAGPLRPASGHDGFCVQVDPQTLNGVSALEVLDGSTSNPLGLDPTEPFTVCSSTGLVSGDELSIPGVYQSDNAPNQQHLMEVGDLKPGDRGKTDFSLHLCDFDSYVWFFAANVTEAENGVTEPEAADPDEDGTEGSPGTDPELADAVQVRCWYDEDCDEVADGSETVFFEGSLAEALTLFSQGDPVRGVPLDGDRSTDYAEVVNGAPAPGTGDGRECFPAQTTVCVGFEWWVPVDHANEIQTDSVAFDLGFYVEQCAANDGSGQAPETTGT